MAKVEVIGAGLGRTGTKSLQAALDKLGYQTYHFPLPEHADAWAKYADGALSADEVFDMITGDGFSATCDQPPADLYAEQLRKFPDAKVILTVRDNSQVWARSYTALLTFIEVQERPFSLGYPTFIQWIPFMRAWKKMRDCMGTHLGLDRGELIRGWRSKADPAAWLSAQYEAHNAQVKATVPSSKLLVFNVKEGWGPLCAFLGKPVPSEPFPCVNESADIQSATKVMKVVSYAWLPALGMLSAAMVRSFQAVLRWRRP